MKFLIVGFGSIGRRHFRNLVTLGENDILFYRTQHSTLQDDELADYRVETNLETALAHKPDAVIIANPSAFHLDVAIQAARQGCHILIEKPISHSLERLEEFSQIVAEKGSRVLVGFQFRYHPNLLKIKELLECQTIGKVLSFRSHWGEYLPAWHPWEDFRNSYAARKELGGGVLLTLCHNFDYCIWLFGDGEVHSSLLGFSSGFDINVEDTAEVVMKFAENVIGSLHLNFTQQPPKHVLEIVGTKGSINWDYYQNKVEVVAFVENNQQEMVTYTCPDDFDRNDLFLQEMEHFVEIINQNVEPICSLDDGIKALNCALEAGMRGDL